MTQADFTIANQTFPNTRTELNTSLQALATNSAGNDAPSTTFPNQWWFDSNGDKLYMRNKDNDAWVEILTIGATSDDVQSLFANVIAEGTSGTGVTIDGVLLKDTSITADALTITNTTAPTFDNNTHAGEAIFIRSGGSGGDGNAQAVLAFGKADSSSLRSGSAIASVQTNADIDKVGLGFYTSDGSASAQTLDQRMLLMHTGKLLIGDSASHTDDLFQIETPSSGGGHGIQIRRNEANSDQQIGTISFGNNTDTDLAQIVAKTDGDGNAGDSGALLFKTQPTGGASTERVRIHSGGVMSASGGVALGVGTANTASNILDDYEEGTWTAALSGTGSSSGQGYDNATMQYTKVGRMVYLTGTLDMSSKGTLGGDFIKITGLPFNPDASNSNNYQPINTIHFNVAGGTAGANKVWAVFGSNAFMYIFQDSNGGASQQEPSNYENSTIVGCSGAYLTAS